VIAIPGRATVPLGIVRRRPLLVGACVDVVRHAVAVAIGLRATVLLRITRRDAGDVRARVLLVEHPVVVVVELRAAVAVFEAVAIFRELGH